MNIKTIGTTDSMWNNEFRILKKITTALIFESKSRMQIPIEVTQAE